MMSDTIPLEGFCSGFIGISQGNIVAEILFFYDSTVVSGNHSGFIARLKNDWCIVLLAHYDEKQICRGRRGCSSK